MMADWNATQRNNASKIIRIGRDMGMSSRDIQIGIMTAMQESSLRNLSGGDRDSAGLFQQRPSAGWGTHFQVTDPDYATRKFFNTLKGVGSRNRMAKWQAAQEVQVSAHPRAYAKHEGDAARLLRAQSGSSSGPDENPNVWIPGVGDARMDDEGQITDLYSNDAELFEDDYLGRDFREVGEFGEHPLTSAYDAIVEGAEGLERDRLSGGTSSPNPIGVQAADEPTDWESYDAGGMRLPELGNEDAGIFRDFMSGGGRDQPSSKTTGMRSQVINNVKNFIGDPYVWGGHEPGGFDCSGLVQHVLQGHGVDAPRLAYQQARWGKQTSMDNIRPGDLVFWGNSERTQGNHIAFYLGGNKILEAPRTGLSVRIRDLRENEDTVGIKVPY